MIGQTLGHYRILEKLGEGGMGEVYLAEDATLKRKVALKVLPAELASSRERLERFQREAESLAALNHPNIVHVYSVEEDQGIHFLTMEFVEGESLDRVIVADGLPINQFLDLVVPLAEALSEAHDRGIVHRDLKPANVMVDGKGRTKILDFGLAKLQGPERSAEFSELPTEMMTEEGKVLGTYPYMSPEQVEGRSVDHRSDIFSFGTMLYEMAVGERPFQGDSPASLMSAILRDAPPDVDQQREELPHRLGRILGRCLEKDTGDRYQRAKDLAKDLEEVRQEQQTGVRVPHGSPASLSAKKRWVPRTTFGAVVVLVAAIALYMAGPWSKTSEGPLISSLAVLPLDNLSGDSDLDYYAAGLTEGLIAELGRVGALRVISRRSVMRYLDSDLSLGEIAAELGVDALIEGSVLPVGDRVRVTAQLVKVDPEQHVWADTYERDAKDILTLLREVTGVIVSEVQVAVSPLEQARQAAAQEVNPEAHRAYLKAIQADLVGTPLSSMEAVAYLREAIAIDPGFAEAWAVLASHFAKQAILHLPANKEIERAAVINEMNIALEKAMELDDSSSLVHSVLGSVRAQLHWDWAAAEEEYLRAIELSPSNPVAHSIYADFLAAMGRFEEAVSQATMAEELDPYSASALFDIGSVFYWAGDSEQSLEYLDRARELAPGRIDIMAFRGLALAAAGKDEEAVRAFQQMQGLLGNYFLAAAFEGRAMDEVNRAWLDFALSMDRPFFGAADFAMVFALLGENDEAMQWLEKAYATRDNPGKTAGWRFIYLKVDPTLVGLHGDPRFQHLLRQMNLAD